MKKFKMEITMEVTDDVKEVMNVYKVHDDLIRLASKYGFSCSGELKEIK